MVLALCGAWGCAQIAGLTGNYQEGAAGGAASGGVAEGQAGENATAGQGASQNGEGGSSSSHGGMSGGLSGDAGSNQAEAGTSEVGGSVSSAGSGGANLSAGSGGASAGSGGATASAGSGGALGGGAGGAPNSGDCKADADCAGGKCVSLSPGGFRTCQVVVPLATTCNSSSDECCTDGTQPCTTGRCVRGPLAPRCGGLLTSGNVCATLGCTTNADCNDNETCVLAGTLDHLSNSCVPGGCRLDSDCKASPGGKCESVTPNCCTGASGLFCVYPTGGCRRNSDCPGGHCYIGADNATAACVTGNGFCPG